jgi:hypothetical protein
MAQAPARIAAKSNKSPMMKRALLPRASMLQVKAIFRRVYYRTGQIYCYNLGANKMTTMNECKKMGMKRVKRCNME